MTKTDALQLAAEVFHGLGYVALSAQMKDASCAVESYTGLVETPTWLDERCPHAVGKGRGAKHYTWRQMLYGSEGGGRHSVLRWMADHENNAVNAEAYYRARLLYGVFIYRLGIDGGFTKA